MKRLSCGSGAGVWVGDMAELRLGSFGDVYDRILGEFGVLFNNQGLGVFGLGLVCGCY